jgi:hypothetical protein
MLEVATLKDFRERETAELFYWAPDFPLLTMEMAYQCSLYFKNFKELIFYPGMSIETEKINRELRRSIFNEILYKNSWDKNKFQASKPNFSRSDWWSWIHNSNELEKLHKNFQSSMINLMDGINSKFLVYDKNIPLIAPFGTKLFKIMEL